MTQPISILLCALGGEGGGVLTDWVVQAARHAGYPVQATSVPGVAQRTGATTYYLELLPQPARELQGQRPVFGLNPLPGRLDVLLSSELLETARQVSNGYSTSDRTLLISSTQRVLTTHEKIQLGDGRLDVNALMDLLRQNSRQTHLLNMAELTRQAGTVVSAVMLGALAASGALPMSREDYEAALAQGRAMDQWSAAQHANFKGFSLAWQALRDQAQHVQFVQSVLQAPASKTPSLQARYSDFARLAPQAQGVASLGVARLESYQDANYAQTYLDHLLHLQQSGADAAVIEETARWLALWMAYDDIVRVADLKSRTSRWLRVEREVRASDDDVLKVYDFFKPGIPEFAGLLPQPLSRLLLRWDHARSMRGLPPLSVPIKLARHTVAGWCMLRLLASLKWLRVRGSRHAQEQTAIAQWLAAIENAAHRAPELALAMARCGRLIKGYGATHARGHDNLQHILRHLSDPQAFASLQAQVNAIEQALEAALKDEAGHAFDQVMRTHGVAQREVRAQPIRWFKQMPKHR